MRLNALSSGRQANPQLISKKRGKHHGQRQNRLHADSARTNVVQAIARDCLAQAIEHLEAAGLPVVFHIHDEVVIDTAAFDTNDAMLDKVVKIMSTPIPWAEGLPLGADGWVGAFFKKD